MQAINDETGRPSSSASAPNSGDALGAMPTTSSASYAARHSPWLTKFDRFASGITRWAGSPVAFCAAIATVMVWAGSGPFFDFAEHWQLVINTGTTLVTFLMVFLIQQSQNKDSVAMHLKLNELLAANRDASNRMIGIEELDEQDLRDVATFYLRLSERAKRAGPVKEAHSIDEEGMPTDSPGAVSQPCASPNGDENEFAHDALRENQCAGCNRGVTGIEAGRRKFVRTPTACL